MSAATARVHLVFGPVGAGKSTYARALATREKGVRFAVDDWMHELFAPDMTPMMFEFTERVFEPPDAAELAGAFVLDTDAVPTP